MVRKTIPTKIGAESRALEAEFDVQELTDRAPEQLAGKFVLKDWSDEAYLYQPDPDPRKAPAPTRTMWPFNTRGPAYRFALSNPGKPEFEAEQTIAV